MSHVLTLNAGSSSLKFGFFRLNGAADDPDPRIVGSVERIGTGERARLKAKRQDGMVLVDREFGRNHVADHETALARAVEFLKEQRPQAELDAVGHRVVHGGPDYDMPVELTGEVMARLAQFEPLAPLHQPHNLAGVRAALKLFPEAVQLACFDTAFHRNHPWVNDTFAIPRKYYDQGVRRYGFHGLSYQYISETLRETAPHLHMGRTVVAHLGNGASMCGLMGGQSRASTMGFTALDGLPMGSRCGQLDPGVLLYMLRSEGMTPAEIEDELYRKSGLLGLSGLSNDMRTLEAAGTEEARQAIDYFVFRIRRELGGLVAALGGISTMVFCGGIGENSVLIREKVCTGMGWIGMELDETRNMRNERIISTDFSRVRILVIPTDEEIVIARAARDMLARRAADAA
ncbi:acetate kinase [Rhodovulum sulfidophilum]|uniref:Acetate kinase n=1 Tax=Rhodovulum sulfidophilum TaxID=35806 RepID=A0ABS1RQ70_RHOSU|nr:acetate/propionate family kinase [Rhodovulum sulfidophilum]ANB34215.1 acetate kinase [Rhodovulum sulfidophilum DSM 1374]ANB38038.1 acetate kinase [Rhodovulum sulfidophilum]MBK5924283.1 acetate kinase [Rhodovulum sulfidophilum]MBL3572631.1 acetate/propionate family kinase [Rhodovulum sulfidophilum]MBL3586171.1 acetate/propionate family kinase [Rhodovulum sulfidophilum]